MSLRSMTLRSGEDGGEDEERAKRPSRSQRLQRKAQLLAAENEQLRRQLGAGARPAMGCRGAHERCGRRTAAAGSRLRRRPVSHSCARIRPSS